MTLLDIKNLKVTFDTRRGKFNAVDGLSFSLDAGKTLGIVGESGCGKSMTSLALMRLLPKTATLHADKILFNGKNIQNYSERQMVSVRGSEISMIFQEPMSSLNPSFTIGFQMKEAIHTHLGRTINAHFKSIELLEKVGIPSPEMRLSSFPHQLSGGMCQRVMIAMAIACQPKLLIADEPTTALDVTIQAQILDLLKSLVSTENMGLILITHDLSVVSQVTDNVLVMYAGQLVESGPTSQVLSKPSHPYTEGLLKCLPAFSHSQDDHRKRLATIPGLVPDLVHRPNGCQLHPRCIYMDEKCTQNTPDLISIHKNQNTRCIRPESVGQLKC